jgi:hypothetical protein
MPFGQGRFRDQWASPWKDHRLLENHPRIRVGGLLGKSELVIAYGGKIQTIVQIEEEQWHGKYTKLRPWFRCPSCNRRCRLLVEKDGSFICQPCSGFDYTCRHHHRHSPVLNRVRRGTGGPAKRVARERILAQVEIATLLRDTVQALEKRSKRGKQQ